MRENFVYKIAGGLYMGEDLYRKETFFHKIDPRLKILFVFFQAIFIPRIDSIPALFIIALWTAIILFLSGLTRVVLIFSVFMLISFVFMVLIEGAFFKRLPSEYLELFLTVLPLTFWGLWLGLTTSTERLLMALYSFRIPAGLCYGALVTLRYVVLLQKEIRYLFLGMRARSILPVRGFLKTIKYLLKHPKDTVRYFTVPLIIRSFRVADRMAAVAELRGLSQRSPAIQKEPISFKEIAFIGGNILGVMLLWLLLS